LPNCHECGSIRVFRDGWRHAADGEPIQRFLCRECGYRFSRRKQHSNSLSDKNGNSIYALPDRAMKNMLSQVSCMTERTEQHQGRNLRIADAKAELIQFAVWLTNRGRTEETAAGQSKLLRILWQRGADLRDPESVRKAIADQKTWCPGRKGNAVDAYTNFLLMHEGSWDPPRYHRIQKLPFIPKEEEIDSLIAGCGSKTSAFLQLLIETGIRAGEAWKLEWTELDTESKTVRVTPEKGSNPRMCRVSDKLLAMINRFRKDDKRIFGSYALRGFAHSYDRQRKKLAIKLQNPRLNQITFHTFRHWKATMEYHRTKDILYVMKVLGHKNIKNTLIYTQLLPFQEEDSYISKVATDVKEARELIEAGFEYITGEYTDGGKIFRKRK
jgi:integrase